MSLHPGEHSTSFFQDVVETVRNNDPTVTSVDLSAMPLPPGTIQDLAKALETNTVVKLLNLQGCDIRDFGAKEFANALRDNTSIETLILTDNGITDEGARMVSNAITDHPSLKVLDLSVNEITEEGARPISLALRTNSVLERLALGTNQLGDEGAKVICNALAVSEDSSAVIAIGLDNNSLTSATGKTIANLIRESRVAQVAVNDNKLGEAGAKEISEALKQGMSVEVIDLRSNSIDENGLCIIAIGIAMNHGKLRGVDLRRNQIGERSTKALTGAQRNKPGVTLLWEEPYDPSMTLVSLRTPSVDVAELGDEVEELEVASPDNGESNKITDEVLSSLPLLFQRGSANSATPNELVERVDAVITAIKEWQESNDKSRRALMTMDEVAVSSPALSAVAKMTPALCDYLRVEPDTSLLQRKRLGVRRMKAVDLLVLLSDAAVESINHILAQEGVTSVLLDVLFEFPVNNILAAQVTRFIDNVFTCRCDPLVSELVRCRLATRIVTAFSESSAKRSHECLFGHLITLGKALRDGAKTHPRLADALAHVEGWSAFLDSVAEYEKSHEQACGGPAPPRQPVMETRMSTNLSGLLSMFMGGFGRGFRA